MSSEYAHLKLDELLKVLRHEWHLTEPMATNDIALIFEGLLALVGDHDARGINQRSELADIFKMSVAISKATGRNWRILIRL